MKLLVVDDDPGLRGVVVTALERAGHEVRWAADGAAGLVAARKDRPDLIVLDIGLPEIDGLEMCRRLRATSDVPILFLTARDEEVDRVLGLELGADDYVTKPFSPRELVARVAAIGRRTADTGGRDPVFRHGAIELEPERHACRVAGVPVSLSATEMALLVALIRKPGTVLGRDRIADILYGAGSAVAARTIDSHLRNLRRKLAEPAGIDPVETSHGVGVRLADP